MVFFILIVALTLNLIWFIQGLAYGAGESGIPFFNTHWHLIASSFAWKSSLLGGLVGTSVAGAPTNWFLWLIESTTHSTAVVQMFVFTSIFTMSGIAIYLLTKELFPKLNNLCYFLAVGFYWFNPFSLVNIWNRFINNYLVFFAFLPLAFYLFLKAIKSKKLIYLIALALANIVFSFVFTSIPFVLILWSLYLYVFLFFFFIQKNRKSRVTLLAYFVVNLLLFVLLNSWWILQEFSLAVGGDLGQTISAFFTTLGNLNTLQILSNQLGLITNLFRFTHGTFFIDTNLWWKQWFNLFPVTLLGFLIPAIILKSFVENRKNKEVLFLIVLFFLGIFVSKGIAEPLSEPFYFLFTKLSILQVFRNPFEKLGIIYVLAAAPLLAFSINYFQQTLKHIWLKKLIVISSALLVFVVWGFPFWTGLVFSGTGAHQDNQIRSYQLQIPDYYKQANDYLKNKQGVFRFLMLPLGGEGNTYTWPHAYSGIDLSASIFEIPNIAFNTTIPLYDNVVANLEREFFTQDDFYRAGALLNVDYLMVRNDIDWEYRSMTNPGLILQRLSQLPFVIIDKVFGRLTLYKIDSDKILPKIYSPSTTIKVYPYEQLSDIFLENTTLDSALIPGDSQVKADITLIKPVQRLYLAKQKKYAYQEAKAQLLYAKNLPTELSYILSQLKEKAERLAITEPNGLFIFDITHLGKRVMEIDGLDQKSENINIINAHLNQYFSTLSSLEKAYPDQFKSSPSNASWNLLANELGKHEAILQQLALKSNGDRQKVYQDAIQKFNSERQAIGLASFYDSLLTQQEGQNYWVYRFNVPSSGSYLVNLENKVDQLQVNNNLISSNTTLKIYFNQGINEIFVLDPVTENLTYSDEVNLDSSSNQSVVRATNSFDPYSEYIITFEYWIKKGNKFTFSLLYDNDTYLNGQIVPGYSQIISSDQYNNDFRNQTVYFSPRSGASKMSIDFRAENENDCEEHRSVLSPSCSDQSFSRFFDKKTEVVIKNIKLQKIYKNNIYLSFAEKTDKVLPKISFEKVNPAYYQVHVNNASEKFLLVFSELYNPGWIILDENGVKMNAQHIRTNGYSNGWEINKSGSFDLRLYYLPQDYLILGSKISIVSVIIVLLGVPFLIWLKKIKH